MILQTLVFLILVLILNFLLFLSINFNKNISYLALTLLMFLNFFSIFLYKQSQSKNLRQPKKETSAEDHPIIKAARERLRK
jgi:positive regulator of sigma E activity